jgi:hypothetical protein
VTKPRIDPEEVHGLVLQDINPPPDNHPFLVSDRKVISQCVEELNRLSYTPFRPWHDCGLEWEVVLLGKDGKPMAGFAFSSNEYVMVNVPGRKAFSVKVEPVPTIWRLRTYRDFFLAREGLRVLGASDKWDEEDKRIVECQVRTVNGTYPRASMGTPSSPGELVRALKPILEVSLDSLPQFAERER